MIGNDVIDLDIATRQSNWSRKGYLDKIFTNLEQEFISKSSNPDETVWNLWSRKEAVYKIILQKGGKQGYYPLKMECLNIDCNAGIVVFENQFYHTKTYLSKEYIHTVAIENRANFIKIKWDANSNFIQKINNIPFFVKDNKIYPASKSHHGKFEKIVWLQS